MGQKTNPISNRIGITRGWDSNWVGGNYAEKIAEDYEIRKYLSKRLANASLSKIIIERTLKLITVTIYAARPGVIIGKGGTEVDKLKEELKKVTEKDVQINIYEVRRPEVDAHIVADNIARQIEGRVSYRRAIKMAIANTMRVGAEGIKVQVSGRVGGAEIARSEMFKEGRTGHRLRSGSRQHQGRCPRHQGVDLQRRALRKAGSYSRCRDGCQFPGTGTGPSPQRPWRTPRRRAWRPSSPQG